MSTMYTEPDTHHGLYALGAALFPDLPVRLIGLTGYAQVGKDTVAGVLNDWGYRRIALADPIKEALYTLNPLFQADSIGRTYRLADAVDELGWEEVKKAGPVSEDGTPEGRRLPQVFGSQVVRELFGEDAWLQVAERRMNQHIGNPRFVVTDIRFPNEAEWVRRKGGVIVRVVRPGTGPVNSHVSDAGLPDGLVDYTLLNDGSRADLDVKVSDLIRKFDQRVAA